MCCLACDYVCVTCFAYYIVSPDSTGKGYGNPKFETIFEMGRRINNAKIGIVSTAYLADATPAAVCTHTSQRSQ